MFDLLLRTNKPVCLTHSHTAGWSGVWKDNMSININLQEAAIEAELILLNRQPQIVEAFNVFNYVMSNLEFEIQRQDTEIANGQPISDETEWFHSTLELAEETVLELFPDRLGDYRYHDGLPGHIACEYINVTTGERLMLVAGKNGFEVSTDV
jgi:Asp-tRNA(Asn)/Glu-tRNA(Gln) amidotransferase B subunit